MCSTQVLWRCWTRSLQDGDQLCKVRWVSDRDENGSRLWQVAQRCAEHVACIYTYIDVQVQNARAFSHAHDFNILQNIEFHRDSQIYIIISNQACNETIYSCTRMHAYVCPNSARLWGYVWPFAGPMDDGSGGDDAEDWLHELLKYNREALTPCSCMEAVNLQTKHSICMMSGLPYMFHFLHQNNYTNLQHFFLRRSGQHRSTPESQSRCTRYPCHMIIEPSNVCSSMFMAQTFPSRIGQSFMAIVTSEDGAIGWMSWMRTCCHFRGPVNASKRLRMIASWTTIYQKNLGCWQVRSCVIATKWLTTC